MDTKLKITFIMLSMLLSITPVTPAGKIDSRTGPLNIPEKIIGGVIDIVQNHKNQQQKPTNQQLQANFQLQQQQGYQGPPPGYQYPTQWNNQLYQNQLQAQYQAQLQAQAQYGNNQPGYSQNQGNFPQNNNNQQNGGSHFEAQAQFVSQSGSYVGTPVTIGSGFPQNQGNVQTQNQNQFQGMYQNPQTGFPSQPIQVTNNQVSNQGQNQYQSVSQGSQGQNQYQSGNHGSQGQNQYQSGSQGSQGQNQYQSSVNGGQMSQNQYQQMSNTGNNHGHIQQTSSKPTYHPTYKPTVTPVSPGNQVVQTQGPVNQVQNNYQGVSTGGSSHVTPPQPSHNQQVTLSQTNQISQGQYQQTNSQGSSGFQVTNGHQVSGGGGGPTCVCQAWSKPQNDDIEQPTTLEDTTIQPDTTKKE